MARSATPFYASGQVHGGILYASGQIGITGADPKTGKKIFAGDTVKSQARQVFKNLEAVLDEAGTSWCASSPIFCRFLPPRLLGSLSVRTDPGTRS